MSRNFELLDEIGAIEKLIGAPADAVSDANSEASLEVEGAERSRILQSSSLPRVFPSADEFEDLSSAARADQNIKANGEEVGLQSDPSMELFQWAYGPKGSDFAVGSAASPGLEGAIREKPRKPDFPTSGLADALKAKARSWKSKLEVQSGLPWAHLQEIAREEEIKLVHRVFPGTVQASPRVALFSSLDNATESAAICARVAKILAARNEGAVCLVDANFGSPSLHQYYGAQNSEGLAEAGLAPGPMENFLQKIADTDLWLLPSGKANTDPTFPAIAEGLRARVEELRNTFCYVIIHGGPLRLESSAMAVSRWTDGVVLVIEANSTPREWVKRAKENLLASHVSLLGVVLNNRTFPIPQVIYQRL